jgi:hypothetical protein
LLEGWDYFYLLAYFCFAITCYVMPLFLLFVRGIEDSQE